MIALMNSDVFQKSPSIIRATEKQRKREREVVAAPEAPIVPPWQWLILSAWTLFWIPAWISLWPDMIINTLFSTQLWPCTRDTSLFDWNYIHMTFHQLLIWCREKWNFGNSFDLAPRNGTPLAFLGNLLASMLDPHYLTCPLFAPFGGYVLLSFPWTPGSPS